MNNCSSAAAGAVVFAYHDIGVRCLETLLELGVDVRLVVTHEDSASEQIWFGSVREVADKNCIPVITPDDANSESTLARVAQVAPGYVFSFYYRQMLGQQLLDIPSSGAFNLHGSLLPKYRGRVPVNWAIIHGEKETGVSLHRMEIKPDAGSLLAQRAVPILRNDTAFDVFQKLKCAAEILLMETVPAMLEGRVSEVPLELNMGSYFSGRKPEDGRIDWRQSALDIHNLVRAVAPPFPGAFFDIDRHRVDLLGSYIRGEPARHDGPAIYVEDGHFQADCSDGCRFLITNLCIDGEQVGPEGFQAIFGSRLLLDGVAGE
ncbi:MAG: formyltransferase [Xanthomonadales bacterium]|nr:formyltransferase [Gammaproteobacteria bacterium]MBT8072872.1 formyltransferase [Gammaproteobacteria bacterium]NNK03713.1 formyltransferase [Xanthomonadales bacterium]NNK99236.1 formyltransferase [Xanthomonadales bacterium]